MKMKDGWHIVCGYKVYIEDGCVMRGVSHDEERPTAPYTVNWKYQKTPYGKIKMIEDGWDNDSGISVEAFRSGVKRGTKIML